MAFLRILILFIIWFFVSIGLLGLLYMLSSTAREMVEDFQMWALKRRIKLKLKNGQPYLVQTEHPLTQHEAQQIVQMFGKDVHKHSTIYDQVAAEHDADPRNILRLQKAKDAADSEFFDKIEEYRNGLDGSR